MNSPAVKAIQSPPPREELPAPPVPVSQEEAQKRLRMFALCATLLTLAFAVPLWQLVRHALATDIASHILLIPFISLYLWKTDKSPLRLGRGETGATLSALRGGRGAGGEVGEVSISSSNTPSPIRNPNEARSSRREEAPFKTRNPKPETRNPKSVISASLAALCGLVALGAWWVLGKTGRIAHNDALSLSTASYLLFLLATALATLGSRALRRHWFAIAFLVFMIPLPSVALSYLTVTLQRFSADAAAFMFSTIGTPFLRDDMVFQLPGLAIRVAEECSGVRSTFVLFITSLLAGHLFLRSGWKKALLALSIFPLGVIRNGFRITVISWLTINVNPGVIDSPLHHRGGPIFFLLSLFPLFALLWLLRRSDSRPVGPSSPAKGPFKSELRH